MKEGGCRNGTDNWKQRNGRGYRKKRDGKECRKKRRRIPGENGTTRGAECKMKAQRFKNTGEEYGRIRNERGNL